MPFPVEVRQQIRERQNGVCLLCGTTPPKLEIHHKVPKRKGGSSNINNGSGLCTACHKMFDQFQEEKNLTYEQAFEILQEYFGK